jgi:ABC-2 type transport system permease protein
MRRGADVLFAEYLDVGALTRGADRDRGLSPVGEKPAPVQAAFLILVSGGFAALSIFVASLMKTRERFMGLGQALIMPLFFASNALYPIELMPPALQYIAVLNPLTYAVDAVRGLLISGDLSNLAVDVLAIIVFDVAIFAVASLTFKKSIE